MKQEIKDIVVEAATKTLPASVLTWWSESDATAKLTALLIVLQIAYVVRKWWVLETDWGRKIKRYAARRGITSTSPAELDE